MTKNRFYFDFFSIKECDKNSSKRLEETLKVKLELEHQLALATSGANVKFTVFYVLVHFYLFKLILIISGKRKAK